jgi:transcriptional regulator with XRE-family HTH domain
MRKNGPDPIDKYVGSRVRMRRLMLGMSQTKLADSIGLTFQQVQKYEKGTNRMGSSRLQQVANVLKVSISFFFEGGPNQPKVNGKVSLPDYVSEFLATRKGHALMHAFMRLPKGKIRHTITSLVEDIAKAS